MIHSMTAYAAMKLKVTGVTAFGKSVQLTNVVETFIRLPEQFER